MKRLLLVLVLAGFLEGCVSYSPSVPKGYDGPVVTIKDSVKIHSPRKADFFYLSAVDDRTIKNSLSQTRETNSGRGFNMEPVVLDHEVPVRESRVTIVGRTTYAADILALTNTVYEVKGDIRFLPDSSKAYVVKGVLGEEYSAIWIEDTETGEIAGEKVEIIGSAALGFFKK